MALVTCSDCGKEVSDRAKACPNCGAPMHVDEAVQVVLEGPKVQKVQVVDPSSGRLRGGPRLHDPGHRQTHGLHRVHCGVDVRGNVPRRP
jgi:hypothetical protein